MISAAAKTLPAIFENSAKHTVGSVVGLEMSNVKSSPVAEKAAAASGEDAQVNRPPLSPRTRLSLPNRAKVSLPPGSSPLLRNKLLSPSTEP